MIKKTIDGHKIPDGYFDAMQNEVCDRLQSEPKPAGMDVPSGYFAQLGDRVMEKTSSDRLIVVHRRSAFRRWTLAAASVVVIAISVVALWPQLHQSTQGAVAADLDIDSALADESLIEDLSMQQLALLLDEEDMDDIDIDLFDEGEIPVYLIEEADLQELDDLF